MKNTRVLVLMGLFIALNIILTRIVRPIETPFLRVSFGFIATALSAMILGPVFGGLSGAISDIIGYFLFPSGSAFFPGFTVSAFIAGMIYGFYLYKNPNSFIRIVLAVITVSLIVDIGLNTIWLSVLLKNAWTAMIGLRAVKTALMFPIQVILIHLIWKYVGNRINLNLIQKSI